MNANFASDAKVSLALGFKNTRKEDSYLKSATAQIVLDVRLSSDEISDGCRC
jgi:hypothetical protein